VRLDKIFVEMQPLGLSDRRQLCCCVIALYHNIKQNTLAKYQLIALIEALCQFWGCKNRLEVVKCIPNQSVHRFVS